MIRSERDEAMTYGVDVSSYNGYVNWKAAAEKVAFAMVKATQGHSRYMSKPLYMFTDSRFAENVTGAYRAGIAVGTYHYLTAASKEEAVAEADYFISVISKYKEMTSLWACVDVEDDASFSLLTRDGLTDIVIAFTDRVREKGFSPMIYTNRNYLRYKLDHSRLRHLDVWQAHWSDVKPKDCGEKLKIWQYGSGKLPGFDTAVDLDYGLFELVTEYRKAVIEKTGILPQTAEYIDGYKYSKDLWKKLYEAML